MQIEIVNKNLVLDIYGFSGTVINSDYTGTAFKLMNKMWQIVKAKGIKNKGNNIWIYEGTENIFAGVEFDGSPNQETGLEHKLVNLSRYAYYKHIGPYNLIKQRGLDMRNELKNRGLEAGYQYIEIYGHWTGDETKLETELLLSLK